MRARGLTLGIPARREVNAEKKNVMENALRRAND